MRQRCVRWYGHRKRHGSKDDSVKESQSESDSKLRTKIFYPTNTNRNCGKWCRCNLTCQRSAILNTLISNISKMQFLQVNVCCFPWSCDSLFCCCSICFFLLITVFTLLLLIFLPFYSIFCYKFSDMAFFGQFWLVLMRYCKGVIQDIGDDGDISKWHHVNPCNYHRFHGKLHSANTLPY